VKRLKNGVTLAAFLVMIICVYSFLNGNGVFKGKFENDFIAWYILAKGVFCSIALYLLVCIIETNIGNKNDS